MLALDPVRAAMTWRGRTQIERREFTGPHVWCVPGNTPHSVRWFGTSAMLVIYLDSEFIRTECGTDFTDGVVFALTPILQQDHLLARFCSRFQDLCHRRRSIAEPMLFAGAILVAAALLHHAIRRTTQHLRHLSEEQMHKIAFYLEKHIREPITPAALAALVGLEEDYFCRLFRRTTGSPVMRYVWRFRVHRAYALLSTGDWKVAHAAAETGFFDQSHLDRHFRREFKRSPGSVIPKRGRHAP